MEMVSEEALKCLSTSEATLCVVLNRSATSSGRRSLKRSTGLRGHTNTSERFVKELSPKGRDQELFY
jgi:hypothetical protein